MINSSHGYGDPSGTNIFTRFTDSGAFANPSSLHVISAGNNGPGGNTMGAPGSGYNGLTVAALTGANSFNTVASFSSRGPQDFGCVSGTGTVTTLSGVRAAVDLTAPGSSIVTAFYGSQTGGNNTSLPGSSDEGSASNLHSVVNGTSFAAPLVASAARSLAPLASNAVAASSQVIKALLLTAADKTDGWSNALQLISQGDSSFLETTQALDWAVGAGRMNLERTFDLQLGGQMDVSGTAAGLLGTVAAQGWDYGSIQQLTSNDYLLPWLLGGSTLTTTLSWMRNVSATLDDQAQANLDLSLWLLDDNGAFSTLVARSASDYNTVEHLNLLLPASGRYGLRVEYPDNSFDFTAGQVWGDAANLQSYGLAWSATAVPGPLPASGALAAFAWLRRLRRRLLRTLPTGCKAATPVTPSPMAAAALRLPRDSRTAPLPPVGPTTEQDSNRSLTPGARSARYLAQTGIGRRSAP